MLQDADKKAALRAALESLLAVADKADSDRLKAVFSASSEPGSEEPIEPGDVEQEHGEGEDEGGHPGAPEAADVDKAEDGGKPAHPVEDDEEELKRRYLAARPVK